MGDSENFLGYIGCGKRYNFTNKFDSEIDIRQVELEHANLIFDDRNTEVYSRIDDVDLRLKLALTKGISSLGVEFENKNILFGSKVNY